MSRTSKTTPKPTLASAKDVPLAKESTKVTPPKQPVLSVIKDIQGQSRKHYWAEEKIRIVLEGLRGESSVAEICRREGINTNVYYRWSKEFLEAGKKRLMGDTIREATAPQVQTMKTENEAGPATCVSIGSENNW